MALDQARRGKGPKPRLLVVLDLSSSFTSFTARGSSIWWSLVYRDLRLPWAYRLFRGKGEKALSFLASLPPWTRRAFRIRVAVVGMRRDGRLAGGGRLSDLRRQGVRVHLRGLSFPV
uniref:hypothetical protein n=1 Tax=Thermus sediminis TaxID=1761908 RepID=UPI001E5688FD|nr:hypothetical protein [Thermus sediminis]